MRRSVISLILLFTFCLTFSNCHVEEFLKEVNNEDKLTQNDFIKLILEKIFTKHFPNKEQKPNEWNLDKDVFEYVQGMDRRDLIDLAYSLEKYHRQVLGQKGMMGGLHDYVFRIEDDRIREYIYKELVEHKEICDREKLQQLVAKSERRTEELPEFDRDMVMGGGIHEYIHNLERKDLNTLALALEKYHRKQKDDFIFGGLHDYINDISEEDLRSYIAKEANEHDEINNIKSIKQLIEEHH